MKRWSPEAGRHRLRDVADPEAARALSRSQMTIVSGLRNKGGESSRSARHHGRHLAVLPWRSTQPRQASGHHRGPARGDATSAPTRRCPRWSSRAKAAAPPAASRRSRLRLRQHRWRSARPTSRCRWSTTRARCSTSCSARATRATSARQSSARPAACSTTCRRGKAPAQQAHRRRRPCARQRLPRLGARGRAAHAEAGRQQEPCSMDLPNAPLGVPEDFGEQLDALFDLIALAWQANQTRVASFMMAKEVSACAPTRTWQITDAFHPLSHHQNDPAKIERLVRIQTYHTQVFAKFIKQAGDHAGWRRHAAGPLDHPVRQQHEQQRPAQQRPAAQRGHGQGLRARSRAAST